MQRSLIKLAEFNNREKHDNPLLSFLKVFFGKFIAKVANTR